MNPNQALWEKGDFTRLAKTMRESGEDFIERIGITKGMSVLDLGCGDGTTAIPAAQLGAEVLGVDIARNLVDAGNARATELKLTNCKIQHGDACDLHELPAKSFDLVLSMFGAMFAPKPVDVAKEMVRVAREGGRIIMGNWIPGHPTLVSQILRTCQQYTPPPPDGFVSPMMWGLEQDIIERFTAAGVSEDRISCEPDTFAFRFRGKAEHFVAEFRSYFGPTMNAFEAAEKSGRADKMQEELVELFLSQNTSGRENVLILPATFMRVTVLT